MNGADTSLIKDIVAAVILLIVIFGVGLLQRRPRPLNKTHFAEKWQELQKLCADKATWPMALIDADKLLDEALRRHHYKGKTMGERLVAAQRDLTDNDGVWSGHKLRNRLVHEQNVKLTKRGVQEALMGFRRALKDLEAL